MLVGTFRFFIIVEKVGELLGLLRLLAGMYMASGISASPTTSTAMQGTPKRPFPGATRLAAWRLEPNARP